MKRDSGKDLTVLGSGSIVSQLTQAGLVDEYLILLDPVVIRKGKNMFEGIKDKINLRLTRTRIFKNYSVLLCYEPMPVKVMFP